MRKKITRVSKIRLRKAFCEKLLFFARESFTLRTMPSLLSIFEVLRKAALTMRITQLTAWVWQGILSPKSSLGHSFWW